MCLRVCMCVCECNDKFCLDFGIFLIEKKKPYIKLLLYIIVVVVFFLNNEANINFISKYIV